jgi:hypothetical protein
MPGTATGRDSRSVTRPHPYGLGMFFTFVYLLLSFSVLRFPRFPFFILLSIIILYDDFWGDFCCILYIFFNCIWTVIILCLLSPVMILPQEEKGEIRPTRMFARYKNRKHSGQHSGTYGQNLPEYRIHGKAVP